jgi:hypothetical protein
MNPMLAYGGAVQGSGIQTPHVSAPMTRPNLPAAYPSLASLMQHQTKNAYGA